MKLFFNVGDIISVLTSEPIDIFLDYKAPPEGCASGAYVEIPLGKRKVFGVVWGTGSNKLESNKLRSVVRVLEAPPMTIEMMAFLEKLSSYTLAPLSSVLRLATRAPGIGTPEVMNLSYSLSGVHISNLTPAREKVLGFMRGNPETEFTLSDLVKNCGVSISVIRGLVSIGAVLETKKAKDVKFPLLNTNTLRQPLTPDQKAAVKKLDFVGDYNAILLKGVTGSGKTEVYLEAISKCISQGQQALVLLPEIGLTSEFLIRVEKRFGVRPAEWHSGVSTAERRRVWKMVGLSGVQ
ncbi:MAG: primosomal protein N' (replication factor Y), partial [Paracoccaceae bacterium]